MANRPPAIQASPQQRKAIEDFFKLRNTLPSLTVDKVRFTKVNVNGKTSFVWCHLDSPKVSHPITLQDFVSIAPTPSTS